MCFLPYKGRHLPSCRLVEEVDQKRSDRPFHPFFRDLSERAIPSKLSFWKCRFKIKKRLSSKQYKVVSHDRTNTSTQSPSSMQSWSGDICGSTFSPSNLKTSFDGSSDAFVANSLIPSDSGSSCESGQLNFKFQEHTNLQIWLPGAQHSSQLTRSKEKPTPVTLSSLLAVQDSSNSNGICDLALK